MNPPPDLVARLRAAGCVFAEEEAELLVAAGGDLEGLVRRRIAGEPLEQVLGWAEFRGLRIAVEPGVFVPRVRTGVLVDRALLATPPGPVVLLDLCCGTGAIGVALAGELRAAGREVELHAAELDPAAVRSARRNVLPAGGSVHEGDLYAALPAALRGRVGVLTANAPYVPTGAIATMPPEARDHEHRVALDGGADGLDVQRRVIAGAPHWLAAGGTLLVETSVRQAPSTLAAFEAAGLLDVRAEHDEEIEGTAVVGVRS